MKSNENFATPSGSVFMILHKGGEYDIANNNIKNGEIIAKREIKNKIVYDASKFMAMRMAPGKTSGHLGTGSVYTPGTVDTEFTNRGLQYLAVGVGVLTKPNLPYNEQTNPVDTTKWDLQTSHEESLDTHKLVGELYRKPFTDWKFLDESGNLSVEPTNVLLLSTTFLETDAVGPLTEMGLFGGNGAGDVSNKSNGGIKDGGTMFNYKTFKVWNKPSDARLTVVWKLTF